MMTKEVLIGWLVSAAALGLPLAARSQGEQSPPPPKDTVFYVGNGAPLLPFGGRVDVLRAEGAFIGEAVKGKPYTADSITETVQILADGNRITHRNEARMYRDSEGRTRREQTVNGLGAWQTANEPLTIISINDPVANVSYFLDPVSHIARQLEPQRLLLESGATPPLPPPGAPAPEGAGGVAVFTHRVAGGPNQPVEPNTQTFELAVPPPEGGVALQGPVTARGFAVGSAVGFGAASVGEYKSEDLGEQVLEGVLAHGTRETQTIPASVIGNERPIESVTEQWYSADIDELVLRRTVDPRFGETTYRLVNLVRSEPSPDLFAVPPDYTLRNEPPREIEHRIEAGTPGERVERRVFVVQPGPQNPEK